ncbi:MAG: heavy metal-associated domain-containing protein [Bacteroidales bacterium]|jgi:copper chaperone CopZ|nr:heavy metal-associated domain-containing protein [Bacteroidales bacterium]MDD4703465.1 heavy metal-associated domain-containing protein [Bacteroidales bacterium]MDX9798566.1 heavy metal-associated domain-containing protein [Bacteroidales bacterium]
MKRTILITALMLFTLSFTYAQKGNKAPKEETAVINLDKFCCKSLVPIIEKTLAYEKGVKSFEVSVENKNVKVVYKPKSTSVEKIAKTLAKSGVEANGFEADPRAIEKLPNCCKNTAKGLSSGCGGH